MEEKQIIINQPCRIDPYKGKSLEVIRNGNKIFTTDGRVTEGDIVTVNEKLAHKMVNMIFGDKTIASYLEEETTEEDNSADEEENDTANDSTENEEANEENNDEENSEEGNEEAEEETTEEDEVILSDMTVAELKAYATENEITIPSSIKSKADIIDYIEEQLKEKTSEEDE